jgi:predicted anti-sigma-YlaC factor YlaD
MECKRFRTKVEEYMASDLGREDQINFETHRGECSECRTYLQDILRLAALLRVNDPVRAPVNLWAKIEARLGKTPIVTPIVRLMRFVSAAAAIALVTLGVLAMQPERSSKNMDRIQTSEISWVSGEEGDELADPIANMLLSPKEK